MCTNPECTHKFTETKCEARPNCTLDVLTITGDGNIIVSGIDRNDSFTTSTVMINTKTGKQKYILKQYPGSLNAMTVVGNNLYFLSKSKNSGSENNGEHAVFFVPLKGGEAKQLELPGNDYYFSGADTNYLYLFDRYNRSILAVDYHNDHEYHTIYSLDKCQAKDCYIVGDTIYTFTDSERIKVTPKNNTEEDIQAEDAAREYTLFSLSRRNISTGEILAKSEAKYINTPWGYITDKYIYLPHFEPEIDYVVSSPSEGQNPYPTHKNTGIDIIDSDTLEVLETVDTPGIDISAIAYADENIMVFYCARHMAETEFCMGWYDRSTGKVNVYNIDSY